MKGKKTFFGTTFHFSIEEDEKNTQNSKSFLKNKKQKILFILLLIAIFVMVCGLILILLNSVFGFSIQWWNTMLKVMIIAIAFCGCIYLLNRFS